MPVVTPRLAEIYPPFGCRTDARRSLPSERVVSGVTGSTGFGSRLNSARWATLGGVQGIVPTGRVGRTVRNSAVPAFDKPGITLFAGRPVCYNWRMPPRAPAPGGTGPVRVRPGS
jgi:hypothetical protein